MKSVLDKAFTLSRWGGALAALGAVAFGHITIWPRRVEARLYDKYTVRAPTETTTATVRIRVEVPAGLMVKTVQSKAGWKWEIERDGQGKAVAVTWSGGEVPPDEFDEFCFIGRNPAEPGDLVWRVYQTARDGQTTVYANTPGADLPSQVTRVVVATPVG